MYLKIVLKVILLKIFISFQRNTANAAGFHQWARDSVTIVLVQSATDSDLKDIYLNENV